MHVIEMSIDFLFFCLSVHFKQMDCDIESDLQANLLLMPSTLLTMSHHTAANRAAQKGRIIYPPRQQ